MSLLNAAERFASIDRSQVVLDTKRCLHSQDQYSDCAACFSICPVDAIAVGKPPGLNVERCGSCLACLPACPVGAFSADDDVADLLNCAAHVEDQAVELLCGLHPQPEMGCNPDAIGIRIRGCLAGLGTGAYLMLAALGLDRIVARTDACRACLWQTLGAEVHRQAARANKLLDAWNKGDTVFCADDNVSLVERILWDAKNPPLSRRDLFRLMARQGQVAMARTLENGVSESKRQPGRDRLRLLSTASHLGEPSTAANMSELSFASLSISEACTACGACGKACLTEALHFEKNEDAMTFSISFSAQNCIACDLCEHVCLPDAITLDHAPAFEQVFGREEAAVAASGILVRCARCKTYMAKREGVILCALCTYRRSHPFGSRLPGKLQKGSGA